MPEERKCPKCKGTGKIDNQLVHRKLICVKCNGTGKIIWEPKRRNGCPDFCDNCKYVEECKDAKLEPSISLPAFNKLNEKQIQAHTDMAHGIPGYAAILASMIRYPDSILKITDRGIIFPSNAVMGMPDWEGATGLLMECAFIIGSAIRKGGENG